MPKRILEKTALEVSRLRLEGAHAVGGTSGLYLQIVGGSRSWVFRYLFMSQRRRMGLGSYPLVSLAEACEALKLRNSGVDPIKAREDAREAARLAAAQQIALPHRTTSVRMKAPGAAQNMPSSGAARLPPMLIP